MPRRLIEYPCTEPLDSALQLKVGALGAVGAVIPYRQHVALEVHAQYGVARHRALLHAYAARDESAQRRHPHRHLLRHRALLDVEAVVVVAHQVQRLLQHGIAHHRAVTLQLF